MDLEFEWVKNVGVYVWKMGMQNIFPDKIDLWVPPALLGSQKAQRPLLKVEISFIQSMGYVVSNSLPWCP